MAKLKPRLRKIATLVSTALCIYLVLAKLSPSTWRPWFSCAVVDSKIERNEQTKSSIISLLQRPEKAAKRIPVFHDDSVISQIRVVKDDVLGYNVCLYENVCVYPNQTVIYTRTAETADFLEKKYSKCFKKARTTLSALDRKFCECFSIQVGYRFQPLQHHDPSAYLTAFDDSPTYLIYNWLPHHHLSHFAFSTVHFHSILQHETFYSLPKFKRVLFQDIPPDGLTAYEKDMWEIIKYGGKLNALKEIQFLRSLNGEPQCYKSIYSSKQSEVYARTPSDLDVFKTSAEKVLGINITKKQCPPSRTLLLVRSNGTITGHRMRTMVNQWHVLRLMESKGLTQIDVRDMNGTMTLKEQAQMISQYGLIISSHSSQLTNLLFAHNNAAVMEVGIIYKPAFRNLGLMARTHYINSVGHRPDKPGYGYRGFYPRIQRECNFTKMALGDVKSCPMSTKEVEAMKNSDYRVHLEFFEKDLDNALQFLEKKCERTAGWIL